MFLPWAVPGLIAGLSWKWLYDETSGVSGYLLLASGIVDRPVYFLSDPQIAMLSIGIAMVWHGLPFFIMMFLAGLSGHPGGSLRGRGDRRRWHDAAGSGTSRCRSCATSSPSR